MNMCKDCGRVRLIPYENQVSGHHKVMLFDESTICKPVIAKEFEFYKSFPPILRKFIPEIKGKSENQTISTQFLESFISYQVAMCGD